MGATLSVALHPSDYLSVSP